MRQTCRRTPYHDQFVLSGQRDVANVVGVSSDDEDQVTNTGTQERQVQAEEIPSKMALASVHLVFKGY